MIRENEKLLLDIVSKAPWLSENEGPLFPLTVNTDTRHIVEELIAGKVTIINEKGAVYKEVKVSNAVSQDRLNISIPSGWDYSARSFHVIFRNCEGQWNSFLTSKFTRCNSVVYTLVPKELLCWQKRRYKRVAAPLGTRAIVREPSNSLTIFRVQDLSLGGILVCNKSSINKFPVGTFVNEVFIFVNHGSCNKREVIPKKIMPMIECGKVARSFVGQNNNFVNYGISFDIMSNCARDNYAHLIEDIEQGVYV